MWQQGVPIPATNRYKGGRKKKVDFSTMQVGDSGFISEDVLTKQSVARCARAQCPNWKFVTRLEEKGVTIWRIK